MEWFQYDKESVMKELIETAVNVVFGKKVKSFKAT